MRSKEEEGRVGGEEGIGKVREGEEGDGGRREEGGISLFSHPKLKTCNSVALSTLILTTLPGLCHCLVRSVLCIVLYPAVCMFVRN